MKRKKMLANGRHFALVYAFVAMIALAASRSVDAQTLSDFDCMIEPHSVADVSTREEGVLEKILVKRGDIVSRGQVVAQLESGLERLALELATARAAMTGEVESRQAKLDYALRQRHRVDELIADSVISLNEKDKADTEVRLAETELQLAKDNHRLMQIEREQAAHQLELRSIRSPVDGVIVEILLVPGESVEDRAREIMTIAEVDPLNVEVILPANLFGSVGVGTTADVTPLMPSGEVRRAEVAVVDRTIDAASDTFGVQLQLDNKDYVIPGGIRCDISFLPAATSAANNAQ
jgi:RND family efflux transporter MFP subunit